MYEGSLPKPLKHPTPTYVARTSGAFVSWKHSSCMFCALTMIPLGWGPTPVIAPWPPLALQMLHLWVRQRAQFLTEISPQHDSGNVSIYVWFSYLPWSFHFIEFSCLSFSGESHCSLWDPPYQSLSFPLSPVTPVPGRRAACTVWMQLQQIKEILGHTMPSSPWSRSWCAADQERWESKKRTQHTCIFWRIACLSFKTRQLPKLQGMKYTQTVECVYIYIYKMHRWIK